MNIQLDENIDENEKLFIIHQNYNTEKCSFIIADFAYWTVIMANSSLGTKHKELKTKTENL